MSRFVRASKYRHVYGQAAKKELCIDNIKLTNSAWDSNVVSASGSFISINWNASGGGAFAILPLPSPFQPHSLPAKLPDIIPLARGHTAPVLDTDWSPHDDRVVASGGEDGHILIWQVDSSVSFEEWGQEKWVPKDFDPVLRIAGSARRIGNVLFHPTAKHVLASATGDHVVKLWDLAAPDDAKIVLSGHTDAIQSMAFNFSGNLLVTTCRDRKIRLFDPRTGGQPVRVGEGHAGIKSSRVIWMGDQDRIVTTGFSKMSDRQVAVWETGSLGNMKTMTVDQSAGVLMPFYSDNGIIFLAGKGDGNIRYYEFENDTFHSLSEYQSSTPQRGMCFMPRRAVNSAECEIARAYKVAGTTIEPIAFIVPRKSDTFQSDIYPPALSAEPALSASEFFSGKTAAAKLVSLDSGAITTSVPSAIPASTRTASAPAPEPAHSPKVVTSLEHEPPKKTSSEPVPVLVPVPKVTPAPSLASSPPPAVTQDDSRLQSDNDRLNAELREARAQIRNLELQVEALKANAQKAKAFLTM